MLSTDRPVLLTLLLLSFVCKAQTTVDILGIVVDNEALALPRANIRLVIGSDTLVRYADDSGEFMFRINPAVQALLITSHLGFDTDYRTVDVSNNLSVEIVMSPVDIRLSGAVITARSRALVGFSGLGVMSINSGRMSQVPSVLGAPDVVKMLQLMPGVQQSGEANGYLYVRGADPGHNLMLYNRVPVYGMSHLLGIFPFYNADHIDRVHFDKAGSNAQFGNRLSATVQAVPPDETPDSFTAKGNIGMMVSQLTVASPLGKRAGVVVSGRQTYIDQIVTRLVNSAAKNPIEDLGYTFSDGNLTLMLHPATQHKVDLNVFASGDRLKIADNQMLLDGIMKWNNRLASISWDWHLGQEIKLRNDVYFSRYSNHLHVQQGSIGLLVQSEVRDWGFESSVDFTLHSIPFTSGVRFAQYYIKPQEISTTHLSSTAQIDNIANAQYLSAYVQSRPRISEFLTLELGLRADYYASFGNNRMTDFRLEPRISLNYNDHDKWTAYVCYARKNQHLHLITTSSVGIPTDFWMASVEGIPIEQADNFSIGAGYRISSRIEINSGIFVSRLYNLVHYPFSILQFNEITGFSNDLLTGEGLAYGSELMLRKTGRLSGWVSYTLSKSDRQFDGIDNGERFLSKFDRRHDFSIALHYEINQRWSAAFAQIFASGNRFTAPTSWYFINNNPVKEYGKFNNAQMPNYIRTDISVDYYIKKTRLRESVLNLSIYNLLAVNNPVYVILVMLPNKTGTEIEVRPRYMSLYSILPSVGWRFKF